MGEPTATAACLTIVLAYAPADHEAVPGFEVWLDGVVYRVTAVLERTAVVEAAGDRWSDRRVVPLASLLVDPAQMSWRRRPRSSRPIGRGRRQRQEEVTG